MLQVRNLLMSTLSWSWRVLTFTASRSWLIVTSVTLQQRGVFRPTSKPKTTFSSKKSLETYEVCVLSTATVSSQFSPTSTMSTWQLVNGMQWPTLYLYFLWKSQLYEVLQQIELQKSGWSWTRFRPYSRVSASAAHARTAAALHLLSIAARCPRSPVATWTKGLTPARPYRRAGLVEPRPSSTLDLSMVG